MTDFVKVEGFSNLMKDPTNGGVVNVDKRSYETYKIQRQVAIQKSLQQQIAEENINTLQDQINTIKSDMQDIRSMLIELLKKGN